MASIFISYSSKDVDRASALAAAIEDYGHEVWWDARLAGGENFRDKIDEYLAKANAIIVLWTENSATSEWVRAEALIGLRKKALIPVRYSKSLNAPDYFEHLHMEYLGDWDEKRGRAPQIDKLVLAVDRLKSEQDKERIVEAIPFGLGQHVENSGALKTLLDIALPGGLRIHRLVSGGVVGAAALWGILSVIFLVIPEDRSSAEPAYSLDLGGFMLLALALIMARGFDQIILVSKRQSSDRFFDRAFNFSAVICMLGGLSLSMGYSLLHHMLADADIDFDEIAIFAVALAVTLLTVSYAVRLTIAAAKLLHSRV